MNLEVSLGEKLLLLFEQVTTADSLCVHCLWPRAAKKTRSPLCQKYCSDRRSVIVTETKRFFVLNNELGWTNINECKLRIC